MFGKEVEEAQATFDEFSIEVKVGHLSASWSRKKWMGNKQELEDSTNEIVKELNVFEQEDAKLQEKKRHLSTKQKKLTKSIKDVSGLTILMLLRPTFDAFHRNLTPNPKRIIPLKSSTEEAIKFKNWTR